MEEKKNILDFTTDNINAFAFLIDESGSMDLNQRNVLRGMDMFQKEFDNFSEAGSVAVSVSTFSDGIRIGEFRKVRELNFQNYNPNGGTWLYYSIMNAGINLKKYLYDITVATGVQPRGTFIVLSDGEPCDDRATANQAIAVIDELNTMGVTTVFCAFSDAITSNWGKKHHFQATINIDGNTTLENFLGKELSKSCKAQSQSLKALGADFFSQAKDKPSQSYSNKASTALEDEDWFEDI